jgi:aspartyl-tRNA(Asn)/glutamyl-tRNA(Gln) amidotransferase subunit B
MKRSLMLEGVFLKVGFEFHIQTNNLNKLFSKEAYGFKKLSNSSTDEYTLGLPGSLPLLNVNSIKKSVLLCNVFNCIVGKFLIFDRKNYFYPDLVKGYQITQKEFPIGLFGYIEFFSKHRGVFKKIHLSELHVEEDVGIVSDYFLFNNFNRSGVSLLELVTVPIQFLGYLDLKELVLFLEHTFDQIRYLNVSECKLQKGHVRCDVNISIGLKNCNLFLNLTEVKNLNSTESIFKCIVFEFKRQMFLIYKRIFKLNQTRC